MSEKTIHPEVEQLISAVKNYNLVFAIEKKSPALDNLYYRRLTISLENKSFSIPVMDEYEDVDQECPAMLLHLILQESEAYEESEDFLVWAKDMGHDPRDPQTRTIYFELREVVPKIRQLLGSEIKAIPNYDIEFNTGKAQALRNSDSK